MKVYEKDHITILLVSYREAAAIEKSIKNFKAAGFKNILVVDGNSSDETASIVKRLGAKLVTIKGRGTFNLAVLRGIYEINKGSVFILSDPTTWLDKESLAEFIEFGVIGDYPLLFPESKSKRSTYISTMIKKRLGIFLDNPGFEAVFINEKMTKIIKSEVASGGLYIFYKLIKSAIDNHLKVGVYPLKLIEKPLPSNLFYRIRRARRLNSDQFSHTKFIRYAFPDLYHTQLKREIIVAIFSLTFGLILSKVVELISSIF